MSYNYDQCVASIQEHRLKAYANTTASSNESSDAPPNLPDLDALQQSMDGFANLSKNCPMTPLLWMQYAKDTEVLMHGLYLLDSSSTGRGESKENDLHQLQQIQAKKEAIESSTGILELALAEFPGSSLLHLYYLESLAEYFYQTECEALHHLIRSESEGGGVSDTHISRNKLSQAFEAAWENVGRGSHVNEGAVVSEIYRLHGSFLLACLSREVRELLAHKRSSMDVEVDDVSSIIQRLSSLFTKWSKTPMGGGSNDEIMEDFNWIWDEALIILNDVNGENRVRQIDQFNRQKATLLETVDANRRNTSSLANVLSAYENEIDVAMSNEGIAFPYSSLRRRYEDLKTKTDVTDHVGKYLEMMKRIDSKWDEIIMGNKNRWLLGLGSTETFHAFSKYVSFLQRSYRGLSQKGSVQISNSLHLHMAEHKYEMINCVYERAVSECPTVESLWLTYIKFLRAEYIKIRGNLKQLGVVQTENMKYREELLSNALKSTSQRSIRNCPYSSNLFELRMTTLGLVSTSNLEPDDITAVIQEATQLGFLNANREAMLSMRLVAITVVKRKLLSLVSMGSFSPGANRESIGIHVRVKDYDQDEEINIPTSNRNNANSTQYCPLTPAAMEEVQDLIEDVRDMYEEVDNYLFQSHATWAEGKVCFWKHRSLTEAYVLGPIGLGVRNALGIDNMTNDLVDKETLKCFEKLVKTQKPCHPDSWREYLRYVSTSYLHFLGDESLQSKPDEVGAVPVIIRQTRALYKRAMSSIRKAGKATRAAGNRGFDTSIHNTLCQRDYDVALSDLCHEYLEFEHTFGSEESVTAALNLVRSKMANYDATTSLLNVAVPPTEESGKRKLETDELTFTMKEDQMYDDDNGEEDVGESRSKRTKVKTNLKEPRKTDSVHKVRIGKIDYPAHPFTIHVTNLDRDTQDMDLVDAFRPTCGAIVHAKIIREKLYGKGGHHSHGESKGAGLVQFEERLAVEKALEKNGEIEIGGKLVKIHRSHMPAVGIVPQGMHRVSPKGEGKVSKRNQLKKKSKGEGDGDVSMECDNTDNGTAMTVGAKGDKSLLEGESDGGRTKINSTSGTSSSPGSLKLDALSFKPRVIKQKPKISLGNLSKK
ncbi:hypothetical protein ACHAW6_008271 [Cyclotella cf. meneghiniana]